MKRQKIVGVQVSDPSQNLAELKMISSIWKGNHTKFIDSKPYPLTVMDTDAEVSSPERYWSNLYDSWKKDPELAFSPCIPTSRHDYGVYKELADFAIGNFNTLHKTKFEVGGLFQVSMEGSCNLDIFMRFYARDVTPPGAGFVFRSKLEVDCRTGRKHVKFCSHTIVRGRNPTQLSRGPGQERTIIPSSWKGKNFFCEPPYCVDDDEENKILSPEELLNEQITDKYLAKSGLPQPYLDSVWKLDPDEIILKHYPKYEAYKELADLAIDEYNKCHDETKFEVIGVLRWSMSGSCPSALSLYVDFAAKDAKSDLQGMPAVRVTFQCRVLVHRPTGTKEVEFCIKEE